MFQREHPLIPRPICFEAVQSKVKENIMNQREIVQALLDSVQRGDFEKAKSLLSNDFQFSGPVPEPINAETWVGIHTNLKRAFPDLDYHFHVESVEGDVTKISAELKGTHSGALDLSAL